MPFNFSPKYISFLYQNIPTILIATIAVVTLVATIVSFVDFSNWPKLEIILVVTYVTISMLYMAISMVVLSLAIIPDNLVARITPNLVASIFWLYICVTAVHYVWLLFFVFIHIKSSAEYRMLWVISFVLSFIYPLAISKYYFFIVQISNAPRQIFPFIQI